MGGGRRGRTPCGRGSTTSAALAADARRLAEGLDTALDGLASRAAVNRERLRGVNDRLARLEQRLLDESEPADTRWYRHVIYGWNIYSLYEGPPLPGLAGAIADGDATAVRRETARLDGALRRFVAGLEEIGALVEQIDAR
ncbi:MAG: transferrin receptor-like dimerization domain-containing protein [Vicinamibacterales bacterium]